MANMLTVREVADYMRVYPATIYRLLKLHQLPGKRLALSIWNH
jgi:excisionase family DNA binding protein